MVDHLVLAVALATMPLARFPRRPLCSTRGSTPRPPASCCTRARARWRPRTSAARHATRAARTAALRPTTAPSRTSRRREFRAAIADLQQLLARTPRDLKTLNLLGIALTGAGRVDEANERFREALGIDRRSRPRARTWPSTSSIAGRFQQARRDFEQVLAQMPGDEMAHLHLAEIEYARKRCTTAFPHYEKAGARAMANPSWILHYGACLLEARQTGAAGHRARRHARRGCGQPVRRGSCPRPRGRARRRRAILRRRAPSRLPGLICRRIQRGVDARGGGGVRRGHPRSFRSC